jgi:hypothetical protein
VGRLRVSVLAALSATASVLISQIHGSVPTDVGVAVVGVLAGLAAGAAVQKKKKIGSIAADRLLRSLVAGSIAALHLGTNGVNWLLVASSTLTCSSESAGTGRGPIPAKRAALMPAPPCRGGTGPDDSPGQIRSPGLRRPWASWARAMPRASVYSRTMSYVFYPVMCMRSSVEPPAASHESA